MYNFCTLFYANYSAKGVALCRSLARVCSNAHIYVIAMDNDCERILRAVHIPNTEIISLSELEIFYPDLLKAKQDRNKGEYSWTCKGPALLYCFEKYGLKECTYLDADMYFFSDPMPLYTEDANADVMLTPHGYTDQYNLAATNGKYCAGYMYFKSTPNGMAILHHWTEQCISWCYGRIEPGRFGDQKYLDEFHQRWNNVYDIRHIGICAPWNIQQYRLVHHEGKLLVCKGAEMAPMVFYHFHFLRNNDFGKYNEFLLGPYQLPKDVIRYIYQPYMEELKRFVKEVEPLNLSCDVLASIATPMSPLRMALHWTKNAWKSNKVLWKRR